MPSNARVNRTLRRLGLADLETDRVARFLSADAEDAAEIVRKALERFVDQIQRESDSKILTGYKAIKQKGSQIGKTKSDVKRRLQRSGAELVGDFEWIVYVDAPPGAGGYDDDKEFNLFNILDAGRPAYPNVERKVIPMFGVASDRFRKRTGGTGGASIAQPGRVRNVGRKKVARRDSNLREGYSHNYDPDKEVIIFTRGPIKAAPALHLYRRALKQAKDDLSGSGFKDWDVIYVGPLRN